MVNTIQFDTQADLSAWLEENFPERQAVEVTKLGSGLWAFANDNILQLFIGEPSGTATN